MKSVIILSLLTTLLTSCDEKNLYAGRVASSSEASAAETSETAAADATVNEDQNEVAEDLSEEALTITQELLACSAMLDAVKASFDVACVDGKATVALADALENPYDGTGVPNINLLQSDDVNGVSQFMVITSFTVPTDPDGVLAMVNAMNEADFTEGNATITQTELTSTPGDNSPLTLTTEVEFGLDVSVGIITVNDVRHLTKEFMKFGSEGNIQGSKVYLTEGAPDNEDNIIADQASFWIPTETGTTIITVSQQHAENRNRHETAEETFLAVAQRTLVDTFGLFN